MAAGDIATHRRPRFETNERVDQVDAEPLSRQALDLLALTVKAVAGKPPAAAGAAFPAGVGWVLREPSVTTGLNLLTIGSGLVVGLDSDGKLIVKENGLALPVAGLANSSTQYIYLYVDEDPGQTEKRRFQRSVSPFDEFTQSIDVKFISRAVVFKGADGGLLQAEAAVLGKQRTLLCLGRATVDGVGNVTWEPTNNRFGTAVDPATPGLFPPNSRDAGGVNDLLLFCKALLAQVGLAKWGAASAAHLGGTAANEQNNFHAWAVPGAFRPAGPKEGLEETNRLTPGATTVGDGVSTFGKLDATDFADTAALFEFILGSYGSTFILKPGSTFTLNRDVILPGPIPPLAFPPATITTVIGDQVSVMFNGFSINLAFTLSLRFKGVGFYTDGDVAGFTLSGSANDGGVRFDDCYLFSAGNAPILDLSLAITYLDFNNCTIQGQPASTHTVDSHLIRLAEVSRFRVAKCRVLATGTFARPMVAISRGRSNIVFEDSTFESEATLSGALTADLIAMLVLTGNVADVGVDDTNRVIRNCSFNGVPANSLATVRPKHMAFFATNFNNLVVEDSTFYRISSVGTYLQNAVPGNPTLDLVFRGNTVRKIEGFSALRYRMAAASAFAGIEISENTFSEIKRRDVVELLCETAGITFSALRITENNITDVNTDSHADFALRDGFVLRVANNGDYFAALKSVDICDNTMGLIANGVAQVEGGTVTSYENFNFDNNTIRAAQTDSHTTFAKIEFNPGVNMIAAILVMGGGGFRDISLRGNKLGNISNWSAGAAFPTGTPCLFGIVQQSGAGEIAGITLAGNEAIDIADAYNGALVTSAYRALKVNQQGTGGFTRIDVSDNRFGNIESPLNLLDVNDESGDGLFGVKVHGNNCLLRTDHAKFPSGSHFVDLISSGGDVRHLQFTTNSIAAWQPASAPAVKWTGHVLNVHASTVNVWGIQFDGNTIFSQHGWPVPGTSFGVGMNGNTIRFFSFNNNIAYEDTPSSTSDGSVKFANPFHASISGGAAINGDTGTAATGVYVGLYDSGFGGGAGDHARNRGWI